jgi:uncharacterized membrane protein YphA (DoxX/SURF4 family)
VFPFPFYYIPFFSVLFQPLTELSRLGVSEFGRIVLDVQLGDTTQVNGSGDSSYSYIWVLFYLALSLMVASVWSVLDHKRNEYDKLLSWLIILLRYYLAIVLLGYGLAKIFKTQFPFPSVARLNQTYGESSPMGLLWTFMGYSTLYNIFTGLGETVAGLLLFFKRTHLLGALVAATVMLHVVVLNLAYDVPVKLFSFHLFLISIFLLIPDTKRLAKFFLRNQTVDAAHHKPIYTNSKTRIMYIIGKGVVLALVVVPMVYSSIQSKREVDHYYARAGEIKPFAGEFEVQAFILNGDSIPTDRLFTRRWKRFSISERNAIIQSTDGASITWLCHASPGYKRLILISPDLSAVANFSFQEADSILTMNGQLYHDTINIVARRRSDGQFLLVERGFHWINEFPFNR